MKPFRIVFWGGVGTAGVGLALALLGCPSSVDPWKGLPGPPRVVVSFPPLYCLARNVGGEDAGILTLTTANGPHVFEPTVEEALKLRRADLLFINGLKLEDHFVNKLAQSSNNSRFAVPEMPGLIRIGDRLLARKGLVDRLAGENGHDEADHDQAAHGHGEYDPHIWLGLPQAEAMVECIRDELKKVDPLRAEGYQKRAADYIVQLQKLHQEGRDRLAGKKEHSLVSFHNSLHYFAKSFGLSIAGVIQTRPGASGDPGTLGDLLKICKEKGVRIIATEPQFRQTAAAQTLLKEMQLRGVPDAQIIEIDTLETVSPEETLDTGWYVRRLRANLDTLAAELR